MMQFAAGFGQTDSQPANVALRGVVARLVEVALALRLLTVVAAMAGLVGSELTPAAVAAIVALAASSFVGLRGGRSLEVVAGHPIIAMGDVLMVLAVLLGLGVGSPFTLTTMSTALLIGVLFRFPSAMILNVTLTVGYLLSVHQTFGSFEIDDSNFFTVVGVPITYAFLVGVGQSFRSIAADQVSSQKELRELSIVTATAEERTRLAREMHDSLAKTLQGIALGVSSLPSTYERDPARGQRLAEQLSEVAHQAVAEARDLLVDLRRDGPRQPLADAVRSACSAWSRRCGVPCEVTAGSTGDLDGGTDAELVAALQELLHNVERHAAANRVRVEVSQVAGAVGMRVLDDGKGFDPASLPDRERDGHFGLRGVVERMESVGGTATVRSRPGAGTMVELRVPLGEGEWW
jgi:signal transduction histidine kinase